MTCACLSAASSADPAAKRFVDDYTALAHQPPGTYSPESYDAANALIQVMASLGADVGRQKVVEGLRTVDHQGLTKEIRFQPDGEVTEKGVYVYEVRDGRIAALGTVDRLIAE
ncbi:ABC transporter substrate-binding protein [Kitasatospora sp. NPDC001527]|uniref:ABC transporter substrate-binding protein n=1 Tax=Kitasatospora sp. NPDC001527 TaxID=3154519 RepID=UPI00332D1AD2